MSEKQDIFTVMNGRVKFKRGKYNITSDAVWLAAFSKPAKTILDVGIGTGGVSLCILAHNPESNITGIDISTEMLTQCADNIKLNNREIELIQTDIINWKTPRTFDLVITNPPYFKGEPAKHNAHHNADLTEWVKKCVSRIRPMGHFCTIVDAAVISEIIAVLNINCGDITIISLFGAKNTAERVLISAKLGSHGPTKLFQGFSMNSQDILRDGLTIDTVLAKL